MAGPCCRESRPEYSRRRLRRAPRPSKNPVPRGPVKSEKRRLPVSQRRPARTLAAKTTGSDRPPPPGRQRRRGRSAPEAEAGVSFRGSVTQYKGAKLRFVEQRHL